MSYIKIQKISKDTVETPEKGYIYFGFDEDPIKGPWIKDDDGTTRYILISNDATPQIYSISPANSAFNGDTITINGANFILGDTSVYFDNELGLDVTVLSVYQLTVVIPNNVTGSITITVQTSYGSDSQSYIVNYKNPAPVITSISPVTEQKVGSYINISGYNFIVGDTVIWFGGISGSTNVSNSTFLTATVPNTSTGSTTIFLETSYGQGNIINYNILPNTDPTISSFSPSSGEIGDIIDIYGSNFASGQVPVYFGDTYASGITVVTAGHMTAIISEKTSFGSTLVRVDNSSLSGFTVTGSTLGLIPTITNITPTNQSAGATLSIDGNNLDGTITVTFSDVLVTISGNQLTNCTIVLPSGIVPGYNSVIITNKYGRSASYTYYIPPTPIYGTTITRIDPLSAYKGSSVNLSGTSFIIGTGNAVYFGNVLASYMNGHTSEYIRTIISESSPTGVVNVKVVNANDSFTYSGFTILSAGNVPTIDSVSPVFAKSGQVIDIYGQYLSGCSINFGYAYPGVTSGITYLSDSHIQAIVPHGIIGSGENKLVNIYAGSSNGTSVYTPFDVYREPVNAPIISSFTPTSGNTGTQIIVYGSYFIKYFTTLSVYINGLYFVLDSQEYISSTEVRGYLPYVNGFTGSTFIKVSTSAGTNQKAGLTIF